MIAFYYAEYPDIDDSIVAENRACAIEDVEDVDVIASAMFAQRMEGAGGHSETPSV